MTDTADRFRDAKALDLRDVAARMGIRLGRTGREMHCPAGHGRGAANGGTPSASISRRDGVMLWNCHACDAGGSVIDLVMVHQGVGKMRALDFLLGDGLRRLPPPEPANFLPVADELPDVSEDDRDTALRAFVGPLTLNERGRKWLESRGLDPDLADRLGVVDTTARSNEGFGAAMSAAGADVCMSLGMARKSGRDRMLYCGWTGGSGNRVKWLLFPCRDASGRIVYLHSRSLNTPTENERRWLGLRGRGISAPWGLHACEDADRIWVVEGATDALTIFQRGRAALALPGALRMSVAWAARLVEWAKGRPFVVGLDSDDSGRRGQARAAGLLDDAGGVVLQVEWPEGFGGDWCDWWADHDDWPAIVEFDAPEPEQPVQRQPDAPWPDDVEAAAPESGGNDGVFERGDEVELGQDLAACLPGAVYDEGSTWTPEGVAWDAVDSVAMIRMSHSYAGRFRLGPVDKKTGEPKMVPIRLSTNNCKGIVSAAQSVLSRPGHFAAAPVGCAFAGTFVRVDGERIVYEPLTLDHRVRCEAVPPWPLPDAPAPPVTMRFLSETWAGCSDIDERISYLFEWLGLALLGIATRYKDTPLLVGAKDSGKSRMLDMVGACFPRATLRSIPLHSLSNDYHRAALVGARLNAVSELPARELMDGEAAKALLAGDMVMARRPYEPVFQFSSRCAHIFAANELPPSLDVALMRRFVVLDCPNVVPIERQDRRIGVKLAAEAPHISAVALAAAQGVLNRGYLTRPGSADALAAEWEVIGDPVREWASTHLERDDEARMRSDALYREYQAWCSKSGHRCLSTRKWSIRLVGLGHERVRADGSRWLVRLLGESEVDARGEWGMWGDS